MSTANCDPFSIKEGDTLPALRATLLDKDGNAVDLTAATAVQFRYELQGQFNTDVTKVATIVTAVDGIVEYQWVTGDTDIPGEYFGEFIVSFGTDKQTFPSGKDDFIEFCIADSLFDATSSGTPIFPTTDPSAFQHTWSVTGSSDVVTIPGPTIAVDSTYMVIATISSIPATGGVALLYRDAVTDPPATTTTFTLTATGVLLVGTIIDIKVVDIP